MRVHELAKDLKLSSKDILEKLKTLKVDVKNHMSVLTDNDVKALKESMAPAAPAKAKTASKGTSSRDEISSIESVKREFLLKKLGGGTGSAGTSAGQSSHGSSKPAVYPPSVKKPRITTEGVTFAPNAPRRPQGSVSPMVTRAKPVVADIKKIFKPVSSDSVPAAGISESPRPPAQPTTPTPAPAAPIITKKISLLGPISVKDYADKLGVRVTDLIQKLIKIGIFASINQSIDFEVAKKIAPEFGYEIEKTAANEPAQSVAAAHEIAVDKSKLLTRPPIVTLMGHVDHGKTSLLDAIRKTQVAAGEAGGITQHIGAYEVFLPGRGAVTFLDTPGHEAFTAMRARGARVTDVVVLVVAADDGVMPQTIEAIDHAKAAGVAIIVAINKMDLPSADVDRVKRALAEYQLMSEDWGGKTVMVGVSARTGKGVDELLEMLALESELLELKADPSASAEGVVIEAELSKESGALATVLVQNGTLHVGDAAVIGDYPCKIRAMINDRGQRIQEATPSMPVEILGLGGVPRAGDRFYVVKDERTAREILEKNKTSKNDSSSSRASHVTLEHFYEDVKAGRPAELKLIIKADVQGSVEALRNTLSKIPSKNVQLNIIHTGTGDVSESDVMLAAASDAVVIGFHVGMESSVRESADKEGVDVKFYDIIYNIQDSVQKAMEGLLEPEMKEMFVGTAEIRQVFKVSKAGMIAGCTVVKGKIIRNHACRVLRAGTKIHEGKVEGLKRFKDDAREVAEGFECGISVSNFSDYTVGDRIEVYEIQAKARKLV